MLNIDVTVIYVPNFILASYIKLKFEKHELTNEANLSTYTDQASHHHVTTLIISSWPFGYSMQKTNEYFVLKVSRKTGVRMRVLPGSSCDGQRSGSEHLHMLQLLSGCSWAIKTGPDHLHSHEHNVGRAAFYRLMLLATKQKQSWNTWKSKLPTVL